MIASAGARPGHSDNPLVAGLGEDAIGPLGVPLVDVRSSPVGHEDGGVLFQAAGGAADDSSVGPALGQAGVNIGEFVNQFNDATKDKRGETVSVVLNVYDDRSFDFILKTAPASSMILKKLGIKSGSGRNRVKKVGTLTQAQLREIAEEKIVDLNANDIEAAMKIIAGSAQSMGVEISEK